MIVLPALASPSTATPDLPTVLVDGVPEPRLRVARVERAAPLDTLRVTLEGPIDLTDEERDRWAAASIELVRWVRLIDGTLRPRKLAAGKLRTLVVRDTPTQRTQRFAFEDAWAARLAEAIDPALLRAATELRAGAAGNRSAERKRVRGRDVHAPTMHAALAWSLGEALDTLAAYAGFTLHRAAMPAGRDDATLAVTLDLSRPLGELLDALREAHGLRLRWRGVDAGGQPRIDIRGCGEADVGRSDELPRARLWVARAPGRGVAAGGQPRIDIRGCGEADVGRSDELPRARLWVARAPGARVEGTFILQPGWDASLEGRPDSDYDAAHSSDFARYGHVYRRWVLNEDAHRPGEATPVFDLTAFFASDVFVPPTAVPFGPCLTRDPEGEPLPAIVEVSLDGGTSWTRDTGGDALLRDRAGVRFTDPTLGPMFLSAAKAGLLRVRVTATLRSPRPMEATRWRGNPFAGVSATRVLDAGGAFGRRRVDASSVFAADVAAGLRDADVADDSAALRAWLWVRMEAGA